jgi:hypothetical protein
VYHANQGHFPQRAKDLLLKLRNVTIFGVDYITTTLSLGSFTEQTLEDVSIEEMDDKFTVFFSDKLKNSGKALHRHICQELSRILNVDTMHLYQCISADLDDLKELFKLCGIREIPTDNDDGSWVQSMLHSEPVVPSSPASNSGLPDLDALRAHLAKKKSDTPMPRPRRRCTCGQSSPSLAGGSNPQGNGPAPLAVPMGTAPGVDRSSVPSQGSVNGNNVVLGTLGNPVWAPFGAFNVPPPATDDKDLVGVMGEHFVCFHLFFSLSIKQKLTSHCMTGL